MCNWMVKRKYVLPMFLTDCPIDWESDVKEGPQQTSNSVLAQRNKSTIGRAVFNNIIHRDGTLKFIIQPNELEKNTK